MLQIGTTAPAFEADSTQGPVNLNDYLGRQPIVLIFYPKDDTPICTKQLCAVRDSKAQYARLDTAVFGVNPGTLEEHRRFAGKWGYDFPIVADNGGAIREMYEVGKILGLFGQQRVVYAINRSGRIVYVRKGNPPTAEILAALEQADV